MQSGSLGLRVALKPLGWMLSVNGFMTPFGLIPPETEIIALGDMKDWKEIKVCPPTSVLTSCDSELICPSDFCRKRLSKNHSFDSHIREHLGLKPESLNAANNKNTSANLSNGVTINYYCNVKGCIYSIADGERSFTKLKYLKQHHLKVHAPKTFVCEQCQKSFATIVFLESHKRMCGQSFVCTCNAIYGTLEALQTHARRKKHSYDHAKYKDILNSVKQAHQANKPEEDFIKEKPIEFPIVIPVSLSKKSQPILLPRPNAGIGSMMTAPWGFDEFKCPKLKVDFGTQTVPLSHHSYHHHNVSKTWASNVSKTLTTSQGESQKQVKRKKSAETQTGQVRVRISTETQTANVVKRRRSNRKRQSAEAQTQCQSEEPEFPIHSPVTIDSSPNEAELRTPINLFPTLRPISLPLPLDLSMLESTTNNSITDGNNSMNGFSMVDISVGSMDEDDQQLLFADLEEVNTQTQTDPDLFLGVDVGFFSDFDVHLNVSDSDVSDFLNFVTTETQTLPGILPSSSISTNTNSDNNTNNTLSTSNASTSTNTNYNCCQDIPKPESTPGDGLVPRQTHENSNMSNATSYLETMDNETQTQCYDFTTMLNKMFGPY